MIILPILAIYFFGHLYCNIYFVEKFKLHLQKNKQNIVNIYIKGSLIWLSITLIVYSLQTHISAFGYNGYSDFVMSYFKNKDTSSAILLLNSQNFNLLIIGSIYTILLAALRNLIIFVFELRGIELVKKTSLKNAYFKLKLTCLHKVYIEDKFKELLISSIPGKISNRFVMIDMSNKKVYVARIAEVGMPDENYIPNQYVIFPILSGYRNEKGQVVFTTDYKNNIKSKTYIKDENIVSIKEFSFDQYDDINTKRITDSTSNIKNYVAD